MESEPVALDLNVDAALVLQSMVGIDSYPAVLALLPNIYDPQDQAWVHAVVRDRLAEAGVVEGDRVHPRVAHWLECLYRPDIELAAHVVDIDVEPDTGQRLPAAMLRLSLVRSGETHVLAVRCDDNVIVQELFTDRRPLRTAAAALADALGPAEPLQFEPITAPAAQVEELGTEPSKDIEQGLIELGADRRSATVLVRELAAVTRRAEVVAVEHHDGGSTQSRACVSLLHAPLGRVAATPSIGLDGQVWVTLSPGDGPAIEAAIAALVQLLPNASWTDAARGN
jgi:hypothetical protein